MNTDFGWSNLFTIRVRPLIFRKSLVFVSIRV